MAITYHAGRRIQGTTSDTAPTLSQSTGGTSSSAIYFVTSSWQRTFLGQEFNTGHTLIDETINSITLTMEHNNPNAVYKLVKLDLNNVRTDLESVDMTWVASNGGLATYKFESFTPFILDAGDKIGIYTDGVSGSNSGNWIKVEISSSDVESNANLYQIHDTSTGDVTGDLKYTIEYGTGKPTDVQVGSRFEETDTRKMYSYEDTLSVTQDFDSNTGHTVNQTTVNGWYAEIYNKIAYDGTNNRLSFTCHDPTNWGASFDLQQSTNGGFGSAISNTKWVLRFKWYILTNSGSTSNGAQGALGISSVPATTISGMDFMGLSLRQHANNGDVGLFNATIDNNNPMNQGTSAKKFVTGNLSASTEYFVEIIRNGDVCTTTIGTDSYGGTTNGGTLDRTVTGISGLRYLYYKSQQDTGSATHTSYIDDIKFYNGVTVAGNAWKEKGTT
jgi:hypothetical protein